jgi:hypothetical protein
MDSTTMLQTAADAIRVEAGNTLYLANASVNGNGNASPWNSAVNVQAGGTVSLGGDQAGAVFGTVYIGNALGQAASEGGTGIYCNFQSYGRPPGCTIEDVAMPAGQSSVVIQGQTIGGIFGNDYSTITLTSNPVIGVPPASPGFGQCARKDSLVGVIASGINTLTLKNATIQCIAGAGVAANSGNGWGVPTVTIDSSLIQNTDQGIEASAGTATVTNTTVRFNYIGVEQDIDYSFGGPSIDLGGGGNTVICSRSAESSQGAMLPGLDVYNASTTQMKADNIAWDDAPPLYAECDNQFQSCNCLSGCPDGGNGFVLQIVEDSSNLGGITLTGASQSPLAVDAGCN